jgi:hypothetical protein
MCSPLAGPVGHKPHSRAPTSWGACAPGVRLSAGTLYAVISRLESRGLIESLPSNLGWAGT